MASPKEILQKYWHYDSFRPLQEEIINSVLSGNDTLALLPTGGGKSLCYQVPALVNEGITLVVSPLIALIKDQVKQLRERHIPAACIVSGMMPQEIDVILNNCVYGGIRLLYVSPERLNNRTFIDHFRQMNISLIAVDEAHCISQWGYDFRPSYLEISRARQYHPDVPVIALTASATPEVVEDIMNKLEFRKKNKFVSSFARKNLSYCVIKSEDKQGNLLRIARNVGGSGIVYVRSRRNTVETAKMLNDNDIPATFYHAGLTMTDRDKRQREWTNSKRGVMVATNAFGMGIDKPDVRFVVHLDLPESPEAYFQEAGRAGRDGQRSYAVIIYHDSDIAKLYDGLDREFPSINMIRNCYRAICNFYQIPVGSGEDCRFDFDIEGICRTYSIDPYTLFASSKFLEREGLFALPEHNDLMSKIHISISKEELYRFQMGNQKYGDVLTVTLRLYGGVFTDYVSISEKMIAGRCGLTDTDVCNVFKEMHRLNIVEYQQKTIKPQIVFTSPRVDIKDIYISDKNYNDLKIAADKRRKAMVAYVTNCDNCRSRQLLDYFGESESSDCQCCDVCIEKRKEKAGTDPQSLEQRIIASLKDQPQTIKQLAERLFDVSGEELTKAVRHLLDKGIIQMDRDYFMRLRNS